MKKNIVHLITIHKASFDPDYMDFQTYIANMISFSERHYPQERIKEFKRTKNILDWIHEKKVFEESLRVNDLQQKNTLLPPPRGARTTIRFISSSHIATMP